MVLVLMLAGGSSVFAQQAESRSAVIERIAEAESLELPELPPAIANFDDIVKQQPAAASEPARVPDAPPDGSPEKPVELALPALPEVTLSADAEASKSAASKSTVSGELRTGSVADSVLQIALPELPAVVVSVEPSAVSVLKLDLDDTRLRALLESARIKYRFKPAEIDAFVAAYSEREFRPYWLEGTGADATLSPKTEALGAVLADADRDALDPIRLVSALPPNRKGSVDAGKRAEIDLQFSVAAFLYARDARGGRLEPARLSALITAQLHLPSPKEVLDGLAAAPPHGIEAALERYHPQHAGYRGLRKALAKLRDELSAPVLTGSIAGTEGAPLPTGVLPAKWLEGPPLAFDKPDPRVPMLRQRLGLEASGGNVYDEEVRKAVIAFQRANELTPNARITPKTRVALENLASPLTLADKKPDRPALLTAMLANMERWRWLPPDLGKFHVFVNVADFDLNLVQDGKSLFQTRVIVGKPQTQTPIFSDEMEHMIVNPYWGVPPSILKKEFLPKMAADPSYAARKGFEVTRRGNSISIRQPPGAGNALGYIKFMFPNEHSVYLHDTPNRNLFQADFRAFSHGCVRVEKPFVLAEKLLAASLGYSEQQLRAMIGRGERMIRLAEKIPVHLTYFTVFIDETGAVQQRRDLYGHDGRLKSALQL